jgi:hypothetical protein
VLRALTLLACCGLANAAHAFCRTTTCDPTRDRCATDAHGCVVDGLPLAWGDACLAVWTPVADPPLPGVDNGTFVALTQAAFDAWRDASCTTGGPHIDVSVEGPLACLEPGSEADGHDRVNSVSVVQDQWPHPAALGTIALTTVSFLPSTGEIVDADIELNAAEQTFTTSERAIVTDLLSALTHEAGHVLGLAHSDDPQATMFPETGSTIRLRTLEPDDEAAICAVYPSARDAAPLCSADPGAEDPEKVCDEIDARASALTTRRATGCSGCSVPGEGSTGAPAAAWSLALIATLCWRRSRTRVRRGSARPRCGG